MSYLEINNIMAPLFDFVGQPLGWNYTAYHFQTLEPNVLYHLFINLM